MYESYYAFSEKPFSLLPDPGFLYLGKKHSMALAMLQYGLESHAGFTVITGDIGCGKTTLIRCLLNEMDRDVTVGLISNTHRSFGELLEQVLLAFRLEYRDKSKAERYQTLVDFLIENYARNRRAVLIVDEAQNLEADTLEELRLLSNVNADKDQVLQLILVGQPKLWEALRRPELEQFAQRISVDYFLEPLDQTETHTYIQHRLSVARGRADLFTPDAIDLIYERTRGIPRLVNTLCDTALVYAYAKRRKRIDEELIAQVINDKARSGPFAAEHHAPVDNTASDEQSKPRSVQPVSSAASEGEPPPQDYREVARSLFGWGDSMPDEQAARKLPGDLSEPDIAASRSKAASATEKN